MFLEKVLQEGRRLKLSHFASLMMSKGKRVIFLSIEWYRNVQKKDKNPWGSDENRRKFDTEVIAARKKDWRSFPWKKNSLPNDGKNLFGKTDLKVLELKLPDGRGKASPDFSLKPKKLSSQFKLKKVLERERVMQQLPSPSPSWKIT